MKTIDIQKLVGYLADCIRDESDGTSHHLQRPYYFFTYKDSSFEFSGETGKAFEAGLEFLQNEDNLREKYSAKTIKSRYQNLIGQIHEAHGTDVPPKTLSRLSIVG